MVSPVPSREPDPHDPSDELEGDPIEELSSLFKEAQTAEPVEDPPTRRSAPTPVPPGYREPAPDPPPEPIYQPPAPEVPPDYQPQEPRPEPEPPEEPPPASVAEVTEAIFAESAALAMNEIADRLDAIEQTVAIRLDAVDRATAERIETFDRAAGERLAALDRAAGSMTFPDELRVGLAKLERMGELAGRVDGTEARIRANAERTIEALRNLNARFEGRMDELGARIESLEGSLERLRQGVEAVAAYVRRVREGTEPTQPSAPTASPEARQVMERVWREPT